MRTSLRRHHRWSGRRGPASLAAGWLRVGLVVAGIAAAVLSGSAAFAEPAADLLVMVVQTSNEPGSIDPLASRLHAELRDQFRYESLRVVASRELRLDLNQSGGLTLPNGRELRVTPMLIDDKGALLAVDLRGLVQTDLRLAPGRLVVIGAEAYEGGRLVVTLELRH